MTTDPFLQALTGRTPSLELRAFNLLDDILNSNNGWHGTRDTEAARVLVARSGCVIAPHPYEHGALAVYSESGWAASMADRRAAAAAQPERRARPVADDFDWEGAILARQSCQDI